MKLKRNFLGGGGAKQKTFRGGVWIFSGTVNSGVLIIKGYEIWGAKVQRTCIWNFLQQVLLGRTLLFYCSVDSQKSVKMEPLISARLCNKTTYNLIISGVNFILPSSLDC